jgi:hypothetical protein
VIKVKAWWKIHDKPRGCYRPLLEWGIYLTPDEKREAEELNINFNISYCIRHDIKTLACLKGHMLINFEEPVYGRDYKTRNQGYRLGYSGRCSNNCEPGGGYYYRDECNVKDDSWACRLPWRPGARPDYSDFIDPVRDFLHRVLEEIERRFQEARESAPSSEWMLEEEFDSFSWRTAENGLEVAERKLRVIRR